MMANHKFTAAHSGTENQRQFPNLTLTFLLAFQAKFLLIRRARTERNFPGQWAFPGGKVEFQANGLPETIVHTIRREVAEETRLPLSGDVAFLDAYSFGKTTGIAFLLPVTDCVITPSGFDEYLWVGTLEELQRLNCIAGIHNHMVAAQRALARGTLQQLDDLQLTPDRYINR